jgi:hypothetical protein
MNEYSPPVSHLPLVGGNEVTEFEARRSTLLRCFIGGYLSVYLAEGLMLSFKLSVDILVR